jgi:UDP-N-acetylglucosamine acyltransferase
MNPQEIYGIDWHIDGKNNKIHMTAIIEDCVEMGRDNTIGAFTVIGSNGEIRGTNRDQYKGKVIIGSGNVISEHVTIQRPYDDTATWIGNNNIIMAHAHVGHNAEIGDGCEICCTSIIAGYVVIEDGAKIKLHSVTRNRITIGRNAIVGMGSVVTKDVPAGVVVYGNPAKEAGK